MTGQDIEAGPVRPLGTRATVSDVARLAGVSVKTASRALNDHPNVKESTRTRVAQGFGGPAVPAERDGPGPAQGRAATTVAFVIGDLTNPFYSEVAVGVSSATAERGLTLLMAASDDQEARERPTVDSMLERRVLALLLVPIASDHAYLEGERQPGTPIVAVDRPLSNAASDSVIFDNRGGARSGVLALADAGHRRVAFVGSSSGLYTHRERLLGYRDALMIRGLDDDPALVREDADAIDTADAATSELLGSADPPEAVFAANNRAAFGAFRAIERAGTSTGLVGFDDFDLAESLGISVVAHAPRDMGRMAAMLALRRIDDLDGPLEQLVLPTTLVLRDSQRLLRRI